MTRFSLPSRAELTAPFKSKEAFIEFAQAPQAPKGHITVGSDPRWTNEDLEPTPPEHRTWTWYNLPLYWFSTKFSTTGWNTGSALIATGLTWQYSFISAVLGSLISGIVVVLIARPGVKYHIGFPVLARSVMGMYGSYFFVFIRAAVCIIWYGIQTFYAGNLLSVIFRCIFGSSWENMPNALPESANITSKQLLTFFLMWILQFPFILIHPRHIHYIFTVKGMIMPFASFGLFGWCYAQGKGLQSFDLSSQAGQVAASTTPLAWSILSGINVIMGSLSPMIINQPDLARYCKKPRDAGALQGFSVFFSSILVFFLGMASTTSLQSVWGVAYWNIWDMLGAILDHHWTPTARAGVFFVALSFTFGVCCTNFGANSIPFGADTTGLFPRWLTIRRGQILCAILGIAAVPWKLISNASAFLRFLGSYNIFMSPLTAIILVDYAFVRRGNIHIPSCYDGKKTGLYWFWSGVNWVGAIAWLVGTTMGIPGLIGQYQPQLVSNAARYMYMMGWILTFATSSIVYYLATRVVKLKVFPSGREDTAPAWEWLANEGREGFYEGEREGQTERLYAESPTPPASLQENQVHLGEKSKVAE